MSVAVIGDQFNPERKPVWQGRINIELVAGKHIGSYQCEKGDEVTTTLVRKLVDTVVAQLNAESMKYGGGEALPK
jgi:hypothetical protein